MTTTFLAVNPWIGTCSVAVAWALSPFVWAQDRPAGTVDKSTVTAIEFRLSGENLDQIGLNAAASATMKERIESNLAGWNFPLRQDAGKAYSHRLLAVIGEIVHQSTPVGFSFSAGDSDPRAPEFQKADVINISCSLTSTNEPRQTVEQTMGFEARPIADALEGRKNESKAITLLVDHVGTVCFNLLDELDLETVQESTEPAAAKPGWMPEIRIETVKEPTPAPAGIVAPAPAATSGQVEKTVEKSVEKDKEGRKQIIIHNQGTPVILKFGHDR